MPESNILFTGDVAQDRGVPFLMDGYLKDWVGTNERLVEIEFDHFMAGHGPIGEPSAIAEARDFIAELVDGVEASIANGQDRETAASTVNASLAKRFGGWRGFERVEESVAFAYDQIQAGS